MERAITKQLFELIQCGVILVEAETNVIVYINDIACKILNLDKSVIGHNCNRVLCTEKDECQFKKIANHKVYKEEVCFISRLQKRKWLLRTANKMEYNGKHYIIESFTDITNQKVIEENYIDLVHYAPAGLYELDLKTYEYLTVNQVMLDYTGYTEEEFRKIGILGILTPESKVLFFERMRKVHHGETVPTTMEYQILTKSGQKYWVLLNVRYIYNGESTPYKAFCIVTDISQRKHTELKLKEEKDKAQMYLDMAFDIFVTLDLQGNITLINKTGCNILRGKEEELLGLNWFDTFVPQEDREGAKKEFQETTKGINGDQIRTWENFIRTTTGEKRYIKWKNKPLKDLEGNIIGTFSSGDDITDQYKEEKQMINIWETSQEKINQPAKIVSRKRGKCPQLECLDKVYQLVVNGR